MRSFFPRVLADFQVLEMNEPIREGLMFSDIHHTFETVSSHILLDVNVRAQVL
jgi:hypothetical protein